MKKFTKFIGIFLCLAMVIGMLSVVGAVDSETPTAPAAPTGAILQGDILEVVSPTKLETVFGFYEEGAIDDPDAFIDCEDGACVTDGWFSRAGYSECTLDDGTIGLIMTIDEVTAIAGIEIVGKNAENCPAAFIVEALVDGAWVEVLAFESNPFTDGLTQMFTFDTVETDTVRIIVTEVAEEGEQVYFNEVTLFTPTTGNLKTVLDLNGKATASDAHSSSNANYAIDGDKSTFFTGSTVTVGLGEATAIDGFNLYHYRNNSYPNNITVNIQKTEGGDFELLGTFATGFTSGSPQDSLYVTFDQTYMAYAVQFVSDVWGYQNDYELWQYQREESTDTPTEAPTAAPTEEPTEEPTEAPTAAPTEAPTEAPTAAPTEPAQSGDTYLQLIPESSLTPYVGDYVNGDFENLVNQDPGEAAYLTDVGVGSAGWIGSASTSGVQAAVIEVGGTKLIGGVELIARTNDYLTQFEIQVKGTDGTWATVANVTEDPFDGCRSVMYTFDPVEATAIRVLCYAWSSSRPMLQEIAVYEAKSGVMTEVVPSGVTCPQSALLPETVVENVIDGFRGNYTYDYFQTAANAAQLTFNLMNGDTGSSINRVIIYAFATDKYAPASITLDLETADGWVTVYNGTAYTSGASDTFVLDLDQTYGAYSARLTVNSTLANEVILTEVDFFGNGEPVAPPAVDPTDPTETPTEEPSEEPTQAPTEEPTQAPTEEPTQAPTETPTTPAEALPEAPVVEPGATTIVNGVVKEGTVYKMVSPKTITTGFGYYDANGTFVDKNDGYCVTDGWYGRAGYSECTTADGQMALIMTLDEAKAIGRVEVVARTVSGATDNMPVDFEIQVLVGDEWVTVADVNENPFTTSLTAAYTFPAVVTTQVRILINAVSVATNVCHLNEVELYEVTTGKLYNQINLVGKATATDAHESAPIQNLTDGDKSLYFLGANATYNLTDADGNPTSIDAIAMYMYRGNQAFPTTVNVMIQKTPGGDFESIGEIATGFVNGSPVDALFAEFDQTYEAYAIQLNLNNYSYVNEFVLYQYEKDEAPEEPPVDPGVDPTDPSEPATDPSEPTTEPSTPTTEPSVPTTEPSVTPTVPGTDEPTDVDVTEIESTLEYVDTLDTDAYTEESVAALQAALENAAAVLADPDATQDMIDEANAALQAAIDNLVAQDDEPALPDVPQLPGLNVDITELQAAIDMIHGLNPNAYTEDSYFNLVQVVKQVNIIIAGGNYTQELIDTVAGRLQAALDGLVLVDGAAPDGGDDDLPADTGDIALTVMTALMSMSAVGGAVVIGKKKFF